MPTPWFRIKGLKRITFMIIFVLLLLSLIPLIMIAKYDLPVGDDLLTFNVDAAQISTNKHALGAVFNVAYEKTVSYYNNWQGTYFTAFFTYLLSSFISISFYGLSPIIMLLAFVISTLYFSYVLATRYLKLDRVSWLLMSLTALLFQIQLLPSITEAFFLLNTAMLYTLSYSLILFMFGLILSANRSKTGFIRIVLTIFADLFAIAVAGGAFSLMLPAIFISMYILYCAIKNREKLNIVQTSSMLLLLIIGTVLSVTAPGNQARVAFENSYYGTQGLSFSMAIMRSIQTGILFVAQYSNIAIVLFAGICAVVLFKVAKTTEMRSYNPIIFFCVTFGLLCMQFTPTYYTLASSGPNRLKNIIFFSIYWFFIFNIFNFEAWMVKRYRVDTLIVEICNIFVKSRTPLYRRRYIVLLIVTFIFLAFVQRDGGFYANPSIQSLIEIRNGTASNYAMQTRNNMQEDAEPTYDFDSVILP